MNSYELLEAKQKKRIRFEQKDEHLFFMKNREILNKFPRFAFLYDSEIDTLCRKVSYQREWKM